MSRVEEGRIRRTYAARDASAHTTARYSWLAPAYVYGAQALERVVLAELARRWAARLATLRVLEVGCGTGAWLCALAKWGVDPARLTGLDLVEARLHRARRLCPPGVALACASGGRLPIADAAMDLVVQATMLTSILDPAVRADVAAELRRVVAPGGAVLWYDFRLSNPRNPDVRGIGRREIARLFPGCAVALRPVTLAPPIARALAPHAPPLCDLLATLPWLRTHYLGVIEPRRPAPRDPSAAPPGRSA